MVLIIFVLLLTDDRRRGVIFLKEIEFCFHIFIFFIYDFYIYWFIIIGKLGNIENKHATITK